MAGPDFSNSPTTTGIYVIAYVLPENPAGNLKQTLSGIVKTFRTGAAARQIQSAKTARPSAKLSPPKSATTNPPSRGCHDALRALSRTVEKGAVNYVVEVDIRGFFDHVDQEQLMLFLGHRIVDRRVLRYIKRFLKAGISEDGTYRASERGTPQGSLCFSIIGEYLSSLYAGPVV